jgi:hypothetical protein
MSHETIILIALIVAMFAVLPTWPHSSDWGYYPSVLVGMALVIAAILVKMGRI